MSQQRSWLILGTDPDKEGPNKDIVPNSILYFGEEQNGEYTMVHTSKLTIKGYQGLTFKLNNSEYPITIFNQSGVWDWPLNNEIGLVNIKFDPMTLKSGQDIIILMS